MEFQTMEEAILFFATSSKLVSSFNLAAAETKYLYSAYREHQGILQEAPVLTDPVDGTKMAISAAKTLLAASNGNIPGLLWGMARIGKAFYKAGEYHTAQARAIQETMDHYPDAKERTELAHGFFRTAQQYAKRVLGNDYIFVFADAVYPYGQSEAGFYSLPKQEPEKLKLTTKIHVEPVYV